MWSSYFDFDFDFEKVSNKEIFFASTLLKTMLQYFSILLLIVISSCDADTAYDARNISAGITMYKWGYLDQPYCVIIPNNTLPYNGIKISPNRWVCVVTGGPGGEGSSGEVVLSLYSDDNGKTWSNPIHVDPNTTLTNAYAVIAMNEYGRIYAMYNFNGNNVSSLPNGQKITRTDSLGLFAYKYSDDSGTSWSQKRYILPYRNTEIDDNNSWNGTVDIMWCVDQTKWSNNQLYYAFTKIQNYPYTPPEELWVINSPNLATEMDIDNNQIKWNMYPKGQYGIPSINDNKSYNAEEGHILPLSDNKGFQIVFRTNTGHLGCAYTNSSSLDINITQWTESMPCEYMNQFNNTATKTKYVKNPRGPITPKQVIKNTYNDEVRYLMLYYNNGGTDFNNRNPYWLVSGLEYFNKELGVTQILWSQPEIILFIRDRSQRPGYCDFIQYIDNQTGLIQIAFTETNKTIARLHYISNNILKSLLNQFESMIDPSKYNASVMFNGKSNVTNVPSLIPDFDYNSEYKPNIGVSVFLILENHNNSKAGQVILDYMANKIGIRVIVTSNYAIQLQLYDVKGNSFTMNTDAECTSYLLDNTQHAFGFVIDGNVRIVTLFVDGYLCDGGDKQIFGWSWLPTTLDSMYSDQQNKLMVASTYGGEIIDGYWFDEQLLTSDLVSFYRYYVNQGLL